METRKPFKTRDYSDMSNFNSRLWRLMQGKGLSTSRALATILFERKLVKVVQNKSQKNPEDKRDNAIGAIDKKIQAHLRADNTDKLQGEYVSAYCKFFECSADYLFGYIDEPTHHTTDIISKTGLNANAVKMLEAMASENEPVLSVISGLIENRKLADCILSAAASEYKTDYYHATGLDETAMETSPNGYRRVIDPTRTKTYYAKAETLYMAEKDAVFVELMKYIDTVRESKGLKAL